VESSAFRIYKAPLLLHVHETADTLSSGYLSYAWHCQACLGKYNPIEATPPDSYVYLPSFRQKFLEAHHVDHLQNKGAVGAKNLLVLCKFHHDMLGDLLSSKIIKDALVIAQIVKKKFPKTADGLNFFTLEGVVAEIEIGTGDAEARLFFTKDHANVWLSK